MTHPLAILPTITFVDGAIEMIDQTQLPATYQVLRLTNVADHCAAIKRLSVRGAPALGVAGAFGLLLAVEERWPHGPYFDQAKGVSLDSFPGDVTRDELFAFIREQGDVIGATRPTAVNLGWAIEVLLSRVSDQATPHRILQTLFDGAVEIFEDDLKMCRALGAHGAELLPATGGVLTHCNTGALATGGYGTALGVVYAAKENGKHVHVYADETRPLLQGARLTAWECQRAGIPVTVLVEGAAATLLGQGKVSSVIVGADRIAANGDTANKIGTLGLAILAKRYGVPFYVAAPTSTIDRKLPDGSHIPIEQRDGEEVTNLYRQAIAPEGVDAFNPAFDVTPADLIAGIITERGVFTPPFRFHDME